MNSRETSPSRMFIKEKPVMTVLAIDRASTETYPSKISQKIDSTYSHTINIISELEDHRIVETHKEGRKRLVKLTEKGERYADILQELIDIDGDNELDLDPDSSLYFLRNENKK